MSRNLYIIVRSLNPNSYLNSIVHCILNENVKRVVFVAVKRPGDSQIPLARIAASVAALLEHCLLYTSIPIMPMIKKYAYAVLLAGYGV